VFLSFVDPALVRKHLGDQVVDPADVVRLLEFRAIPAGTPVFLDESTMRPVEPLCSWFRHLVYEEKDAKTLREYAYMVRRFVHFLESRGRSLLEAIESDFTAYRALRTRLQDKPVGDATWGKEAQLLNQLYGWMVEYGHLRHRPIRLTRKGRNPLAPRLRRGMDIRHMTLAQYRYFRDVGRKVEAAAVAAASEAEFFAGLEARGVQVRLRHSTIDPAAVTGYAVGLPGDLSKAGTQVWFSGGKLAPDLTLPRLRHRWDPSTSGMPGRLDVREVYAQATAAAQLAAQEIRAGKRGASHTIWAAADMLTAAADATGNHELQVSADFFRRAALEPWGRIPRPSPTGQMVRASARFLAATRRAARSPAPCS
jgi:hypothetical protein